MAKYAHCVAWPTIKIADDKTGELKDVPSYLYKRMLSRLKDRELTNYLYAVYLQKDFMESMDAEGYIRNKQNQHKASDVFKKLKVYQYISDRNLKDDFLMKEIGAMDENGEIHVFKLGSEAVSIAKRFNDEHTGKIAYVTQTGEGFTIGIANKDSKTLNSGLDVTEYYKGWNELDRDLQSATGVKLSELEEINPTYFNPLNVGNILSRFSFLKTATQANLSEENIQILLMLSKDTELVNRLMETLKPNGVENYAQAAKVLYDAFSNPSSVPSGQFSFYQNVINKTKELGGLNLTKVKRYLEITLDIARSDIDFNVANTIKALNDRFGTEKEVMMRTATRIRSLSDATMDAIANITRMLRNLETLPYDEKTMGSIQQQTHELAETGELLTQSLRQHQYYDGLLRYMAQGIPYINKVLNLLKEAKFTEDTMASAMNISKILEKATNVFDTYYSIASAMEGIDKIILDDSLSKQQKANLKEVGKKVKDLLDMQKSKMDEFNERILGEVALHFLGAETTEGFGVDGTTIAEMISGMNDTTKRDLLYSIARCSNPLVGSIGSIIREAQRERDNRLQKIGLEIDRITDRLFKSGIKHTDFMYEIVRDAKGHPLYETVLSDIDWTTYNKERTQAYFDFIDQGISGFELLDRMKQWEYENTIEDDRYGTKLRVPNLSYRKPDKLEVLNKAQREYYDAIMNLKAQLHELMPEYAQHLYLAPQVRAPWEEQIKTMFRRKMGAREMMYKWLDSLRVWKFRNDDATYYENGKPVKNAFLINGKEHTILNSDFQNNEIRNIPLFYIKGLEDSRELTHDFSYAMRKLAKTAINYDAMSNIQALVETMSNTVKNIAINKKSLGKRAVDVVAQDNDTILAKALVNFAGQNNVSEMLNEMIAVHLYGRGKEKTKMTLFIDNLLSLTRIKALAMNVKGFINNELMGEVANLIDAIGGEFFNLWDYTKASVWLFTERNVMDLFSNNKNSMAALLQRKFNPIQENYSKFDKRYHSTIFGNFFDNINYMLGYEIGEYMIHMKVMYSILSHEKVLQKVIEDGKEVWNEVSLMDVIKKADAIDGNSELYIDGTVTTLDGRAIENMDDPLFDALTRRIEYANQNFHGAMNAEDRGVISQRDIVRLGMTFRQWMIEHYSRRYRRIHYDNSAKDPIMRNFYFDNKVYINGKKVALYEAFDKMYTDAEHKEFILKLKDDVEIKDKNGRKVDEEYVTALFNAYKASVGYREGYYTTVMSVLKTFTDECKELGIRTAAAEMRGNLTENQKYNIKRLFAELILFGLSTLQTRLAPDPDDDDSFIYRMWLYQIKRLQMELRVSNPVGAVMELGKLINQPIPSQSTFRGLIYPIWGLATGDFLEEGKYRKYGKGYTENKYWHNIKRYSLPFYSQIEQLINFEDDDDIYKVFEMQFKAY